MQRWEYTSVWFDDLTRRWTSTFVAEPAERLVDLFNELGRLGWELCAPILTNEASDSSLTVHLKHDGYVFKRPTR